MNRTAITRALLTMAAAFVTATAVVLPVHAENIEGTVVIKKKLTKRRVTAQVPLYMRGPAVELGADAERDPLASERSRVAVYLEGQLAPPVSASVDWKTETAKPAPAKPAVVTIEQTNRRFSPEMVVIQAGSKVSFPNNDPIFHNIFSLAGPKSFDLGNYPKGDTRMVTFPESGIVYVNCHLHPNMTATIVVTPNKWNTRADRDGRFQLADVPPGKFTIVAWHKATGFLRQTVVVEPGRDAGVEFLIPIDENGRALEPARLETRKRE
jgi:plastocyanin